MAKKSKTKARRFLELEIGEKFKNAEAEIQITSALIIILTEFRQQMPSGQCGHIGYLVAKIGYLGR